LEEIRVSQMKLNEDYNQHLSEKEQLARCLSILSTSRICAWRNNTGVAKFDDSRVVRFGTKGQSDILGFVKHGPHRGKFFAYEVKAKKNRPTYHQHNFLENLGDGGCIVGWGTSNHLVDLLEEKDLL
tara:strand:- start:23844 stop:24224 length:381 start_codon:yes stop_codon:yes gene_type:complete